jgi:hypothetical protein
MNQRPSFSLLLLPLAVPFLIVAASATTLPDPLPEHSTTHFGQLLSHSVTSMATASPILPFGAFPGWRFRFDRCFLRKTAKRRKNFCPRWIQSLVLKELNDPEFEQIQPQHFGGQLGYSMSTVADLDGDRIAELIAGAPHHIGDPGSQGRTINPGEAFVFSGKDSHVLFNLLDPTAEEDGKMGTAVAGLGDVDADGTADLLVGVPGKDIGGEDGLPNVGLAYVFSGSATVKAPSAVMR